MKGQRSAAESSYRRVAVWLSLYGLLGLVASGCEVQSTVPDGVDHADATLVGKVVHAQTGEGMAGVRVQITGLGTVYTGEGGVYSFHTTGAVDATVAILTAERDGFAPASLTVEPGNRLMGVPLVRLTPLADPIMVGPNGVSALLAGGVRVEVEARASRQPTSIRVTPLVTGTIYDPRLPGVLEHVVEIHLSYGDLEPLEQVRLTVPISNVAIPGQHLLVRRLNPVSARWDSVATALVAPGGRSATLAVTAQGEHPPILISTNERIRFSVSPQPTTIENVETPHVILAECEWGPKTFPGTTVWRDPNLSLPPMPESMLPLRQRLEDWMDQPQPVPRQTYEIKKGQRRTLEVWLQYDVYEGPLWAIREVRTAGGDWYPLDSVVGSVSYHWWEWDEEWDCHGQGETQ